MNGEEKKMTTSINELRELGRKLASQEERLRAKLIVAQRDQGISLLLAAKAWVKGDPDGDIVYHAATKRCVSVLQTIEAEYEAKASEFEKVMRQIEKYDDAIAQRRKE